VSVLAKRKPQANDKTPGVKARGLDPYAVLGVSREADDEQIKRAFRFKAKECHPDLGGDADKFEALRLCYDTLIDPVKRAEFDRTGEIKKQEPDNTLPDAYNRIGAVFQTVLAELKARSAIPEQCDLIRLMRLKFEEETRKRGEQRAELKTHIPLWESFRGRFSTKKGRNYLGDLVASSITQMGQSLKDLDRWDRADKMALTLMNDYDFRFDQPRAAQAFTFVEQVTGFNTGTRW